MKKELKHKVKDMKNGKGNQVFQKVQLYLEILRKNPEIMWENEENLLEEQTYMK